MYLQEIFDQLAGGELAQTELSTITEDKWPRVINQVNLGLADLFKRFNLREGRLSLSLIADRASYPLDAKYAVANRRSKVAAEDRFILDSVQSPFADDVLKIEQVLTAGGEDLVLNDPADPYAAVATDTYPVTLRLPADVIAQASTLPEWLRTESLQVVYRARHPKISVDLPGFDPTTYDVRLPDSHLQALLYYIASRVLGLAGVSQQEGLSSTSYWKHYEAECAQLAAAGVQLDRDFGYDRLRDRGFV